MTDAYAEAAPVRVPAIVVCTWTRTVASEPVRATITPDGCADMIVQPDGRIIVAGPDTGPHDAGLGRGVFVGLRFRVGAAGSALGLAASALRDQRVPLEDVWKSDANRLVDRLAGVTTAEARRAVLEDAVAERVQRGAVDEDRLVLAAVALLRRREQPVAALAWHLGVSERQLLRRFDAADTARRPSTACSASGAYSARLTPRGSRSARWPWTRATPIRRT
ncbi:MAG TPA: DUF6597 domain-containing transcriptional factor [Polyangiaceae bacterium]|jgi:hypothetical protein|nr:DUF6597 domain-containing transcriptional factor [Polyangiaceae bacterium]